MFKIGGVSLDISHPKSFAECLVQHQIGMRYEYIFHQGFRKDDEVEWFIQQYGLKGRKETIEEMVGSVDIGFIQSCNWEKHIDEAMPFINAGKPVFIDKPIVGSIKDIKRAETLIQSGAKILGSSSLRYCTEVVEFLERPVSERGEVLSLFGVGGVDDFNYCVHIVEAMSALADADGCACQYKGKIKKGKVTCEVYHVEYENGVKGVYCASIGQWQPFHITVVTTKGTYTIDADIDNLYVPLLQNIYNYLGGYENRLANALTLINCIKIMLCGKRSRDAANGKQVSVTELSEEDRFDGYLFEKKYAEQSKPIYKN